MKLVYFFMVLDQITTFCMSTNWRFSQFLVFFLWRKFKIKFLLASMKSLTSFDNPSSNPLQETCSVFQVAACDSKSCSESRLFRKLSITCAIGWKKSTNDSEGKPEEKFWCGFGTIFRISKCFDRSKQKLFSIFSSLYIRESIDFI